MSQEGAEKHLGLQVSCCTLHEGTVVEDMAADLVIRRANAADGQTMIKCLRIAFEPFREFYSREGFDDTCLTPETIGQRLESMAVYVAEQDGEIVGTIAFTETEPHHGHLRGMAVLPNTQGSGIARELLELAENELGKIGCLRITLDTTAPLQRAIRFYERNGYKATGKVGDHFGMPLYEYEKRF